MKKSRFLAGLILAVLIPSLAQAQTSGTMTFSATLTSHNSRYGTSHVVAVWIEDNSGAFVKTRLRDAKTNHTINNHLPVWKANSNLNVVDAVTGSTLTSYSTPISVSWDGTDVSGTVVTDDTYKVFIEESWDEGSSGTSSTSISFNKDTASQSLTPTNTTEFTSMSLTWVPAGATTTAVVNAKPGNNTISVYPNPSNGLINVDFNGFTDVSAITVFDMKGEMVSDYPMDKNIIGTQQLDLSALPKGTYFISVFSENGRAVLTKKVLLK